MKITSFENTQFSNIVAEFVGKHYENYISYSSLYFLTGKINHSD